MKLSFGQNLSNLVLCVLAFVVYREGQGRWLCSVEINDKLGCLGYPGTGFLLIFSADLNWSVYTWFRQAFSWFERYFKQTN